MFDEYMKQYNLMNWTYIRLQNAFKKTHGQ